jgi:hypothetical protein
MMIGRMGDSTEGGKIHAIIGVITCAETPGTDPMITTKETAIEMTHIIETTTEGILIAAIHTGATTMVTAASLPGGILTDQDTVTTIGAKMIMGETTAMTTMITGMITENNRMTSTATIYLTKFKSLSNESASLWNKRKPKAS